MADSSSSGSEMKRSLLLVVAVVWAAALVVVSAGAQDKPAKKATEQDPHKNASLFTHSENCVACHNNLTTVNGEDVSIGAAWRSTMMANSARDPYWQASVRRETIDHQSK